MERKPMGDNSLTMGLDGADDAAWHTPGHEIDEYMVIAVAVLAGVLLLVASSAALRTPPVLQWWQLGAMLFTAAFCGFAAGVVTMALAAMAHSDMDGAE